MVLRNWSIRRVACTVLGAVGGCAVYNITHMDFVKYLLVRNLGVNLYFISVASAVYGVYSFVQSNVLNAFLFFLLFLILGFMGSVFVFSGKEFIYNLVKGVEEE